MWWLYCLNYTREITQNYFYRSKSSFVTNKTCPKRINGIVKTNFNHFAMYFNRFIKYYYLFWLPRKKYEIKAVLQMPLKRKVKSFTALMPCAVLSITLLNHISFLYFPFNVTNNSTSSLFKWINKCNIVWLYTITHVPVYRSNSAIDKSST